jgi:hypothetical protein
MDRRADEWMDEWMDGWMDGWGSGESVQMDEMNCLKDGCHAG